MAWGGRRLIVVSSAIAADTACESDKRAVAECFDTRGRLRINANGRMYIWPVGSDRMLTVRYDNATATPDPALPANVATALKPGTDVFADYRVRPLSRYEAGTRQTVCVRVGNARRRSCEWKLISLSAAGGEKDGQISKHPILIPAGFDPRVHF